MRKVFIGAIALAVFFGVNVANAECKTTGEPPNTYTVCVNNESHINGDISPIDLSSLDSHLGVSLPAISMPAMPDFAGFDLSALFKK